MFMKGILSIIISWLCLTGFLLAQEAEILPKKLNNQTGTLALGVRSTLSHFSEDGAGLGTGGQFRIRLSPRINTDWFADYISIQQSTMVRSEYLHIGWSVMYYVLEPKSFPAQRIQPFVMAGHCFDYNKKTLSLLNGMEIQDKSRSRWGSAVQAGLGTHFHLSPQFEISLKSQYMMHLTSVLEVSEAIPYSITEHKHSVIEGHLLTTVSLNYSLLRLWKN